MAGVVVDPIEAARDLLISTRRSLQLVDQQIALLQGGRAPVMPADDVSSEHRTAWYGAVDDIDEIEGVRIGSISSASSYGFSNPKVGTIRIQEDAAFVCTNVFLALARGLLPHSVEANYIPVERFFEDVIDTDQDNRCTPMLRLTDANTGRSLITGMTVAPLDRDRGAIPFTYFSTTRPGLGSNVKNKLFSEFTIPRAGVIRAEVYNLGNAASAPEPGQDQTVYRAYVTLFGFKVFA